MNDHLKIHKEMYERNQQGESKSCLAREFGLTISRVSQMIARWETELKRQPQQKVCAGCKKTIDEVYDYPFVEKHWGEIDGKEVKETWHSKCFVIWHSAHVGIVGEKQMKMIEEVVNA